MNGTSMDSARNPYAWMNRQWEIGPVTTKPFVEAAAAFNAVVVYHPLRTMGTQLIRGEKISCSPFKLYRGFTPGLFASHQLFLMGAFDALLKDNCSKSKAEFTFTDKMAIVQFQGH